MNFPRRMTNDLYQDRLREVTRLFGENAAKEEIIEKARQIKIDISNDVGLLSLTINTLDNLVASFAPSTDWQMGWLPIGSESPSSVPVAGTKPPKYDRSSKTMRIAVDMLREGITVISTKEIAAKLKAGGDTASDSTLATAVGNVLSRTGAWRRIGRGQYELIEREVVEGK